MAIIPKVLKNFNLFIDGSGLAGLVQEVTLPTFSMVTEDHRAGGMDVSAPLAMGMEAMEMSFTMAEQSAEIIKLFGLQNQNAVSLTFRAALVDDVEVVGYALKATGLIKELNPGSAKAGEKSDMEVSLGLRFIELTIGEEELLHIDATNMIRRIGGVDQLEAQRRAIGA